MIRLAVFSVLLLCTRCASGFAQAPKDKYGDPLPDGAVARIGTVRLNHAGHVYQLLFAPDEALLLSIGERGLRSWRVDSGEEAAFSIKAKKELRCMAFSPDGKTLAIGTSVGVRIYEYPSGKELRVLATPGEVQDLAFVRDGAQLLATEKGPRASLWDTATWERRVFERGEKVGWNGVSKVCAEASPCIYYFDGWNSMFRWQLEPVETFEAIRFFKKRINDFVVTKGFSAYVGPEGLRIIKENKGEEDKGPFLEFPGRAVATRENLVAASDDKGTIYLIQSGPPKELRRIDHHNSRVDALAFSPSGRRLASASTQGVICMWDVVGKKHILSESLDGGERFDFLDNHTIVGRARNTLFSAAFLKNKSEKLAVFPSRSPWISLSSQKAIVSQDARSMLFLKIASKEWQVIPYDARPGSLLVAASNGRQFASLQPKGLSLWEFEAREPRLEIADTVNDLTTGAFTPDSRRIIVGNRHGVLQVFDTKNGKEVMQTSLLKPSKTAPALRVGTVYAIAPTPDNRYCFASSFSETWKVDLKTGTKLLKLPASHVPRLLVMAPEGAVVAGGYTDSYPEGPHVTLWSAETGEKLCDLIGHQSAIVHLEFSPDGRFLATSSRDNTMLIWNVESILKKSVPSKE